MISSTAIDRQYPPAGRRASKLAAVCIFLLVLGVMPASGIDVKGKAPSFGVKDPTYDSIVKKLNTEIENVFNKALDDLNKEVGAIDSKPEKFIQAWGNSSIFASHGAPQWGYGGYEHVAFTFGPMIGIQLPGSPFKVADDMKNIADTLKEERDLKIGLNPQVINGRFGLNTSKFLLKNLYLGVKFGYIKLDSLIEGFSFDEMSLGLTANYQLVPRKKMAGGLVVWRGLNLGTGFIYQNTNIGYKMKLDSIEPAAIEISNLQLPGGVLVPSNISGSVGLKIDPSISLDMDITTFTIPLEAVTSVRLLWFLNFALGVGADFGFGKSDMKMGVIGDITPVFKDVPDGLITQNSSGNISASEGGDMAPGLFNPKLMGGLGLSLGPVIIDVPVAWYFMDNGYSVGVTLGFAW
jgi:hypothetical protein